MITVATGEPVGEELRLTPRRKVLLGARIVLKNKNSTFDVVIKNLSQTGALLLLPAAMVVPEQFDLRSEHFARSAHVVWQRGNRLGVRFE